MRVESFQAAGSDKTGDARREIVGTCALQATPTNDLDIGCPSSLGKLVKITKSASMKRRVNCIHCRSRHGAGYTNNAVRSRVILHALTCEPYPLSKHQGNKQVTAGIKGTRNSVRVPSAGQSWRGPRSACHVENLRN